MSVPHGIHLLSCLLAISAFFIVEWMSSTFSPPLRQVVDQRNNQSGGSEQRSQDKTDLSSLPTMPLLYSSGSESPLPVRITWAPPHTN